MKKFILKNKKILLIIIGLLIAVIGVSLAFIIARLSSGAISNTSIISDTTDNLKFNVDKYACKEAINKGYDELVISFNRIYSKETILKINEITNKRFIPILLRTNGVNTIDINLNFKEELNNNFSSYLSIYNEEEFKDNNLEIIAGKIPIEIEEI